MNEKYENLYWLQTYTGIKFDLLYPTVDMINIRDIAHSLSQQCRYNGHAKFHYSIAQHSILVASILPDHLKLTGLLHDAAEAYIGDIIRPIKNIIPQIKELENPILETIARKYNFIFPFDSQIKKADNILLAVESEQVVRLPHPDNWYLPEKSIPLIIWQTNMVAVEAEFLSKFFEYSRKV